MKLAFYIAAAAMIAVALALLLLPLVRHGRRLGRPRGVFALALLIAFAVPLATAGLYLLVGTPVALNGVPTQKPPLDIDQAVAELRQHLAATPDDLQGWMLLAQTMNAMHQPEQARDAYDRALRLDGNNTAAMVGWAEADSMTRPDHRIEGRAQDLLERAVQLEPENQRGLWLLGIGQFQHDRYADAAATWRRLLPLLAPGSNVARAVAEQIAVADARSGKQPVQQPAQPLQQNPQGPQLQVEVSLSPALKDKLAPGDTLFVYARAEQGPPMPLAVAKLPASTLPTTVTLTDAMGMTPQLKLSAVPRVFVGARISRSGQAIAQAGDLEGDAGVVEVNRKTPIPIAIDKVH
ncbi:cytochrome C biogenesis protein CcmI [Frateuria sp. Soil773]|uniref:tetratricopeptide repeat protein n=1 Tax=Frateuria sp. Soil773 TaxID=1736407 RepID=UPI0006F27C0A|nr:tetratricopeptide repeat protein [Frateuria sp. Soil773]KRE92453.1 cytochrome C biogenesis protein CcmI [Frateuria sp. Soil773]